MSPFQSCSKASRILLGLLAIGSLLLPGAAPARSTPDKANGGGGRYLFICAGDQARTAPDFLAVINFDQESSEYGKVITSVPFAAPDASGNEPHHIGLSQDGRVVGCGGLLSILKGQKEIFFFDVSDPK